MPNPLSAVGDFLTYGDAPPGAVPPPAEDPDEKQEYENDGTLAPLDGDQQDTQFGPNFCYLDDGDPDTGVAGDPEAVEALRQIILWREKNQIATRQAVLRRCAAIRLYFDGFQEIIWDEHEGAFLASGVSGPIAYTPEEIDKSAQDNDADAMTIINVMRPHGTSIGATICAQRPKIRFWPADTSTQESRQAAEEATYIAKLIQRNNKISALQRLQTYLLMTDGVAFSYVRYVTDAQRFGYRSVPITEPREVETDPEGFGCTNCGQTVPQPPPFGAPCPGCGAPPPEDGSSGFEYHPAVTDTDPAFPVGEDQVPDGQEVITIEGHLEVEVPYGVDSTGGDMSEIPWLFYKKEYDRSAVKAAFPEKADKITESSDPMQETERQARLGPKEAGYLSFNADNRKELLTVRRCWLRPANFWMDHVSEEVRERLIGYFPKGSYVCFAGDTFLEARSEAMERKWRMMHAYETKGQNRPGLLQDCMGAQDILNSAWNIRMDAAEKGLPIRLFNTGMLSSEALRALDTPGAEIGVKITPPDSMENAMKETGQVEVPGLKELQEDAMAAAELLSGDFAALQGAPEGHIDTASGYSLAVNQAKGRFAPVWDESQRFWDETNFIAVECFLEHRPDLVTISLEDRNGKPMSKEILCEAVKGQFEVYPESDPDIPTTFAEVGAKMAAMVGSPSPSVQAVVAHPGNASEFRKFVGNDNLIIPGEYDYEHQIEEIEEMMAAAPAGGTVDPMTGQPSPLTSSLPVNPIVDNHEIHMEAIKTWAQSPEGREAAKTNPQGFANVMLHAQEHMAAMAPPPIAGPPGAGPGGPPQGPPGAPPPGP